MIAGNALLLGNDTASKLLTQSYAVGQVICLRQAATLLIIVPYIMAVTRWGAVLIGFAGVLLIVQPGAAGFEWVLLLPVATALISGLRGIVTRRLSRTDTSISILFCFTLIVMLAALATAPIGWKAVDAHGALLFLLAGASNAGAHFLMIEALRMGEASLVSPFRYTSVVRGQLV